MPKTRIELLEIGDIISFTLEAPIRTYKNNPGPHIVGPILKAWKYREFPGEICLTLPQGYFWFPDGHHIEVTGEVTQEEINSLYIKHYLIKGLRNS